MPASRRLNWIQRLTLIFFVTVLTNWLVDYTTGYSLIGGDLYSLLLIAFVVLLTLTLIPPLVRKLL